jgi:glutathione S-transferase
MFAPVTTRFRTYAVKLSPESQRYCDAVLAAPGVRAWVDDAVKEKEFVQDDEPYAAAPTP